MQHNENHRLVSLKAYDIMDTASEEVFDDLTRLASIICEAPIALISLVDDKRQWFKSKVGLDTSETPREQAFCAHAMLSDDIMVVEDAHLDDRFVNNPLVTGDPNIRFYAGAPLTVNGGDRLGTLCVIDTKPRKLSEKDALALRTLGQAVVSQLEYRRVLKDLKDIEKFVPICAWCRSIRVENNGAEEWQPLHDYVAGIAKLSHGICPSCQKDNFE
jgi:GAF domain-containing protein